MFTLKFTTGIRPTERNMQLARAAQIYYHQGAYSDEKLEDKKPVEQAEQKKPEQKKPAEAVEKKPVEQAEQKKPVDQKKPVEQAEQKKPVDQKKPEVKAEQKPVADKKPAEKPEQKKPEVKAEQKSESKAEQKPVEQKPEVKAEQKPVDKSAEKPVEPVVEVIDRDGNIVAMLPGVPEEAPKAARTTAAFDINNFVKPAEQKASTNSTKLNHAKSIDEVYTFIRNTGVPAPFDPMPGYSAAEKTRVLKGYANFNGTHPGMDILQLNTLIMVFNSPDLARKMINCGLDPKQVLGVKRFNEVPANKYDNNNAYDFAFEYTLSKKKKLVLLVNSIPTYDEKQGWMSGYNISVR